MEQVVEFGQEAHEEGVHGVGGVMEVGRSRRRIIGALNSESHESLKGELGVVDNFGRFATNVAVRTQRTPTYVNPDSFWSSQSLTSSGG